MPSTKQLIIEEIFKKIGRKPPRPYRGGVYNPTIDDYKAILRHMETQEIKLKEKGQVMEIERKTKN